MCLSARIYYLICNKFTISFPGSNPLINVLCPGAELAACYQLVNLVYCEHG